MLWTPCKEYNLNTTKIKEERSLLIARSKGQVKVTVRDLSNSVVDTNIKITIPVSLLLHLMRILADQA